MSKIYRQNGRHAPAIVCDVCGELIRDAEMAVAMRTSATMKEGETCEVRFAHKGKCHDQLEDELGHASWITLSDHLYRLVTNCGLPPERLQKMASDEERIGVL